MAEKDFPFIILNGPKLNDPGQRRVIRKQAMKDVGNARRKRGNYGKTNLRQVPAYEKQCRRTSIPIRQLDSSESSEGTLNSSPDTGSSLASTNATEVADDEIVDVSRDLTVSMKKFPVADLQVPNGLTYTAISLFSSYETARAKFSVDVIDLAMLTNFNVSKGTIALLADPSRLASLLGQPQWYVISAALSAVTIN